MYNFTVSMTISGHTYTFNAADINRSFTDGAGNPIYAVWAACDDGTRACVNLAPDWSVTAVFPE